MNEITNKLNSFISKLTDASQNGDLLYSPGKDNSNGNGATTPSIVNGSASPKPNGHSNGTNNNNHINNSSNNKPKLKYKNWCGQVEKKCHLIITSLPTLDTLTSHEDKKKEKATTALTKVNGMLGELSVLLDINTYKPSNKGITLIDGASNGIDHTSPNSSPSTSPPASSSLSTSQTLLKPTGNPSNGDNARTDQSSLIGQVVSIKDRDASLGGRTGGSMSDSNGSNGKDNSKSSTRLIVTTCRDSMMTLWGAIIVFVEKFYNIDRDLSAFYSLVMQICKRKEFDTIMSPSFDPLTYKPWSSDVLLRYRIKLYKTFSFVGGAISATPFPSVALAQFCAKFFAVAFFRIPKVAKLLLDALAPPETEIVDIISHYPCPQVYKHLCVVGERPDKSPFHSLLMQSDSIEKELDLVPHGWLDNIARKENLFFVFLREWIGVCKYAIGDCVDIKLVPGFYTLTYALLHEIKTREQTVPPQFKTTPALESHFAMISACHSDAALLEAFIKIIFRKTCVFDLGSVGNTLGIVEAWIKEYGVLPETFDINFFCEGIDSIIAADHHQVVIRALNLIYNTSDCFQGQIRQILFRDLLHKYFYQLFLHWDQPVRNAYHHILLYRMVRIKRSSLYQSGFTIGEFSKLTHVNTTMTKSSINPTKYPDKDDKGDHSYNSSSRLGASTSSSISSKQPKSPRSTPILSSSIPSSPPSQSPLSLSVNNNNNNNSINLNNNSNTSSTPTVTTNTTNISSSTSSSTTITIKKIPPPVPPRNMTLTLSSNQQQQQTSSLSPDEPQQQQQQQALSPRQQQPLPSPRQEEENNNNNTTANIQTSPLLPSSQPIPTGAISPLKNSYGDDDSPHPTRETLDKFKEYAIDLELFLEIEIYQKKVTDQFRSPELKYHDPKLSNYVAASLSEFKTYIAIGNQANATPPKIIPLMYQGPTPLNLKNFD